MLNKKSNLFFIFFILSFFILKNNLAMQELPNRDLFRSIWQSCKTIEQKPLFKVQSNYIDNELMFERACWHEAAHVCVAYNLGLPVLRVQINLANQSVIGYGSTELDQNLIKSENLSLEQLKKLILFRLAGYVIEEKLFGYVNSSLYKDFDLATHAAVSFCCFLDEQADDNILLTRTKDLLINCLRDTRLLIEQNLDKIELIKNALLRLKTLNKEDIEGLVG